MYVQLCKTQTLQIEIKPVKDHNPIFYINLYGIKSDLFI